MKSDKLIRIALRSISRTKMRSMLTMLGIIIGVGAVICMVAIGQGAQSRIEQSIQDLGVNMVVITPGASSAGGVSRGAGSFNRLQIADAEKLARESMLLSSVSPVIVTGTASPSGTSCSKASRSNLTISSVMPSLFSST